MDVYGFHLGKRCLDISWIPVGNDSSGTIGLGIWSFRPGFGSYVDPCRPRFARKWTQVSEPKCAESMLDLQGIELGRFRVDAMKINVKGHRVAASKIVMIVFENVFSLGFSRQAPTKIITVYKRRFSVSEVEEKFNTQGVLVVSWDMCDYHHLNKNKIFLGDVLRTISYPCSTMYLRLAPESISYTRPSAGTRNLLFSITSAQPLLIVSTWLKHTSVGTRKLLFATGHFV